MMNFDNVSAILECALIVEIQMITDYFIAKLAVFTCFNTAKHRHTAEKKFYRRP